MKRIVSFFWSLRHQFIKYFIIGISGVILDIGSLVLLKEYFHLMPVVAVVINQVFLLAFNFTLNKYWSFRDHQLPHRQMMRYLMLAGFDYLFSITIMYYFNQLLGYDYRLVRIASIAAMVSWNFFLYKYWVYKVSEK